MTIPASIQKLPKQLQIWWKNLQKMERRLAAILAADVVNYSLAMGQDEDGTLATLTKLRHELISPLIKKNRGRIVKLMGDGFLVEFPSVVDAMNCALAWQDVVSNQSLKFRIGINLGDVIVEDDDIHGNGVNVASRLEGLASAGGICVSANVYEEVHNRIGVSFEDMGLQVIKNIDQPVHVWRWVPNQATPSEAASNAPSTMTLPLNPSVAVLPFDNMSGDPEQEYFADGITEDIITDLSKIPTLFVIARNSSFVYRGKSVDLRKVSTDLNVGYVLEGSVRRAGSRVRITAQLIDGTTGGHIWAERYDRELEDIFVIQDEITCQIVEALSLALDIAPLRESSPPKSVNAEAFDYTLRARQLMMEFKKNSSDEATRLYQRAIDIDPELAIAHWGLAMNLEIAITSGWTPPEQRDRALTAAETAVRLDPLDSHARKALAVCYLWRQNLERSLDEIEKATDIAPGDAEIRATRGYILSYKGRPAEAVEELERAMQLDPQCPDIWLHFMGLACYLNGEFSRSAELLERRIRRMPQTDMSRALLISCYGQLDRKEDGLRIWNELKDINPDYSFQKKINSLPYVRQQDRDLLFEGLHKTGISNT